MPDFLQLDHEVQCLMFHNYYVEMFFTLFSVFIFVPTSQVLATVGGIQEDLSSFSMITTGKFLSKFLNIYSYVFCTVAGTWWWGSAALPTLGTAPLHPGDLPG